MNTSAVLFDLDGTLADTAPDLSDALNRLLEEEGRSPLALEKIRTRVSYGARGLVACGFGELPPAEEERLIKRFEVLYARQLCDKTQLFPGVEETLQALTRRDVAWGVVTNKNERFAAPIVEALGLARETQVLICGDAAARKKPAPDLLLLAADKLTVKPSRCLYVGDSKRDVEAAKAAGMPVLIVTHGYDAQDDEIAGWDCDGVLGRLGEILRWIDDRNEPLSPAKGTNAAAQATD